MIVGLGLFLVLFLWLVFDLLLVRCHHLAMGVIALFLFFAMSPVQWCSHSLIHESLLWPASANQPTSRQYFHLPPAHFS